ncbi:MAG: beta-lactamase family protein [Spirochaetaceae bacterium]|nr:beta-lactamase family protein [Spirochaetaceae bacterium]
MKNSLWILLVFLFSLSTCTMPFEDIVKMSGMEMIEYNTKRVKKAAITVGIVQSGQMSYKVYGENGRELSHEEHIYEIGSITKTFTTSLLSKAVSENKVSFDDSISRFLNVPAKDYYPSIKRLITHTSGYKNFYYEDYGTANLPGRNPVYGTTGKMLLNRIGTINPENRDYPFVYSNFGMAVVGLILESIYNEDYTPLMNGYIKNELGLNSTKISDGSGDLANYWQWDTGNPYIATGAITSTITDMMRYAKMQIDETPPYLILSHGALARVNATPSGYDELTRTDAVGAGWMIDSVNNIVWHGGGTGNYNSYLGFDKTRRIAVVVLSNMSDSLDITAAMIGSKLLGELQGR